MYSPALPLSISSACSYESKVQAIFRVISRSSRVARESTGSKAQDVPPEESISIPFAMSPPESWSEVKTSTVTAPSVASLTISANRTHILAELELSPTVVDMSRCAWVYPLSFSPPT